MAQGLACSGMPTPSRDSRVYGEHCSMAQSTAGKRLPSPLPCSSCPTANPADLRTHSLPPMHVKPPVGVVLDSTETTASPVVEPQLEAVAMPARAPECHLRAESRLAEHKFSG